MKFERSIELPVSAETAFAWHERPGAFIRLRPPWQQTHLLAHKGGIKRGACVSIETKLGPLEQRWEIEHGEFEQGRLFTDRLLEGPFKSWQHRHVFEPISEKLSTLHDRLEIEAPLGAIGRLGEPFLRDLLSRVFAYRHRLTLEDLMRGQAWGKAITNGTVLIAGITGTIGQALAGYLQTRGYRVAGLSRSGKSPWPGLDMYDWDPAEGRVAQDLPNDVAVVINLAGESIIGRWTTEKRRRIIESRTRPIEVLSAFLKDRGIEPDLWINASGVGYYGPRGESVFGEESPLGSGFLAEVCRDWEAAAMTNDVAKRTIAGRFGVVMSAAGGALKQMLPAFNVGAGGPLGNKAAYMPWITLLDLVYALEHCMQHPEISGPVNFTAPGAVTQAGFARALGKAVKRPAFLPTPAAPLKLVFGDMATETLLIDQQVEPSVLKQTGFRWSFPEIEDALKFELGRL